MSDVYIFLCSMALCNILGLGNKYWYDMLFFTILGHNCIIDKKTMSYHRFIIFGLAWIIAICIFYQFRGLLNVSGIIDES